MKNFVPSDDTLTIPTHAAVQSNAGVSETRRNEVLGKRGAKPPLKRSQDPIETKATLKPWILKLLDPTPGDTAEKERAAPAGAGDGSERARELSPLDRPLPASFFSDRRGTMIKRETLSLRELATKIEQTSAADKNGLPLVKLATFGNNRSTKGAYRHDANVISSAGVEGDYDGGEMSAEEAVNRLKAANLAGLIYTTPSHTDETPRWRVFCPCAEEHPPESRAALLARVNGVLGGVLARESFTLSQSYYFGRVEGAPFALYQLDGRAVDRAGDLDGFSPPKNPQTEEQPWSLARDESRSGRAFRLAMTLHSRGEPFETFESELAADKELKAWAADKRQVLRTWHNASSSRIDFDEEFEDLPALPSKAARSKLKFLSPEDCENAPWRGYVVKGFVAPRDISCIFGAPGAGKSVIAPHIAYAVAQGREVFGRRTKPGRVFYVAAEDPTGMRMRVKALRREHGDAPDFTLVEGLSNLADPAAGDFAALMDAVKEREPALIVIDTLAMAFPGLDENAAEGMSRVVKAAETLVSTGAALFLVHHDTKAEGGTPRGHSVLNGAFYAALHVKRDISGVVRGKLTKNRNGPMDGDFAFTIESAHLGEDEDGDPITAPIASECLPGSQRADPKISPRAHIVLEMLRRLLAEAALDSDNVETSRDGLLVPEGTLRDACIEGRDLSGSDDPETRKRAFRRAMNDLARQKLIYVKNDGVRLYCPFDDSDVGDVTS